MSKRLEGRSLAGRDGAGGAKLRGGLGALCFCWFVSTQLILVILQHFSSLPGLTNDRERKRKRALTRTPTRTPNLCKGIGFSYCRCSYGVLVRVRVRVRVRSRLRARCATFSAIYNRGTKVLRNFPVKR